ncbi:hypothetical protein GRR92_03145 [Lactococcus lactis subsp. lactis]|uniref:hypothetical protein n=1 Tax=Lactococcus lactis TaxID=1358 RepID=UPI001BA6FAC9|nr:hypothetical protein [Lactococcus lactis]MBR8673338.1 hypothetical protein [Lactococcus lactis subsp. lactis]MBR8676153.1 hypothetical protein [Lactococcus lactis subsp. lactis]MBR8683635.1 hypothetical protein [Lactococcus lactis subsp. lactis]
MNKINYFYTTLSVNENFNPMTNVKVPPEGNLTVPIRLLAEVILDEDDSTNFFYEIILNDTHTVSKGRFENSFRNRILDGNYTLGIIFDVQVIHVEANQMSKFSFNLYKNEQKLDSLETHIIYY